MNWKKASNIFILLPLITAVSGNFSLGPVVAGLTGLTWGIGPGSLFISITTVLLLILTGNINMELIFLYLWSLAYLIQAGYVLQARRRLPIFNGFSFSPDDTSLETFIGTGPC